MQISATPNMVRWRALIVAVGTLILPVSSAPAQLRLSGPTNQLAVPPVRENPMRLQDEMTVAQPLPEPLQAAQFQAVDGTDLAPVVPPATAEAAANPLSGVGPSLGDEPLLPQQAAMMPEMESLEPLADGAYFSESPYGSEMLVDNAPVTFSTGSWFRRGMWYSQQDLTLLLRTDVEDIVISADNSATAGSGGIGTKTMAPSYVPGTRLTIGRFLGQDVVNRDHMVEFVFFGLFDYSNGVSLESATTDSIETTLGQGNQWFTNDLTGGINGPSAPGFGGAQRHDLFWDSDLNSYELNFRLLGRPLRDHLALQPNGEWVRHGASSQLRSFLLGMRAVSLNEMFRLDASFSNPVVSGRHEVHTGNDMFGVQGGVEVIENYNVWSWGIRGKFGGLFNFAERRLSTLTIDGDDRTLVTQNLTKENMTALLEGGLVASYQIRPNLTVRGAYDIMYLTGIAGAPQNAGLEPGFPPLEVTNDALYHGMSIGLEMLW